MSRSNHRVAVFGVLIALVLPQTARAVSITATAPPGNEKSAARTTNIAATADAPIQSSTVTQSTFRVQGDRTGRIAGAYSATGSTFTLDPSNDLKPGETIRATATSGIEDTSANALTPRVWQFTAAAGAGTGVMVAHPTALTSATSDDVALADLDGDGDLDAVIANADNNAESVWLNDGTGTFAPHPSIPLFGAESTFSIALGDLDGDGDPDLVAGTWQPPYYETVWLNDGTGGFTAHPVTPQFGSGDTWDLALGDLDGDGDLDCLVSNHSFETNTVWLNDGSGSFTAHPTAPAFGGVDSLGVALGDLDGDGDLDAVLSRDGAETVWLNDGSGAFTAHPTTPVFGGEETNEAALGDLDGDGDLDAVLANSFGDTVWLNDGDGNFTLSATLAGGTNTKVVNLGDLDGDGDLDCILANFVFAHTVWLNDGAGNFSAHPIGSSFSGNSFVRGMALGDLDGDDDLDGVTVNSSGSNPNVWFNAEIYVYPATGVVTTEAGGTATFSVMLNRQPTANVTIQLDTSDATEGRLSTDGVTQQNSVTLTFTNGDWSTPQVVTVHGQNDGVDDGDIAYTITTASAVSSDPFFSGSNAEDVFASNTDDDTAGVSVTPAAVTVAESGTTDTFSVVLQAEPAGDVVMAVTSSDTSEATVSASQLTFTSANWSTPQVVTVTGVNDSLDDGHQVTAIVLTMNAAATDDPAYDPLDPDDVNATTLDDDFRLLALAPARNQKSAPRTANVQATASSTVNGSTVTQTTFRVQGEQSGRIDGTYGSSSSAFELDPANAFKPGETIRATATTGIQSTATVPLRKHVWQFTAAADIASGVMIAASPASFGAGNSTCVALGDVNGDGDLDAIVCNYTSQAETVWIGNALGGFTQLSSFGGGDTNDLALGDLDGDGDLDAVAGNSLQDETVWLNDGSGIFTQHPTTMTSDWTTDVSLGDLDGDGDLDAVIANTGGPHTVWLNDGTGLFSAHPATSTFGGAGNGNAIGLGDLDGDGDLDAVVANQNAGETVWTNDGAGNFSAHPSIGFGSGASFDLALGDLDGDGDLDAVVANGSAQAETVWRNNGSGTFSAHPTAGSFGDGESRGIVLGDLDGDGDLDAIVANIGGAAETVWMNDGTGAFTAHPVTDWFGAGDSYGLALGDLDSDGDLDAVIANAGTEGETVWLNRDAPGIDVAPASGLVTSEGGPFTFFTVTMQSQPVANVSIQIDSADTSEVLLSLDGFTQQPSVTLTFAPEDVAQNVIVHGQNDSIDDGDVAYTIVTNAAVSTDPLYSGMNAADVTGTNNDDGDTAGVQVSTNAVSVNESGTTATFTVVLASEPTGNVVIDVASNDTGEATVSPAQLTFTNANWSTPQTVTVTGVDDAIDDGDQLTTLDVTMNLAATADPAYDAIDPANVTATTVNDDIVLVIATNPVSNAKAAPRTANVQATANATLDASTVTQSTFRVQGEQTGRIAGTYSGSGATFQLDPASNLKPGELIRATATRGIETPGDLALHRAHVWQFTAAAGSATGAMMAHPATASFGGDDSRAVALGDLDGDGDLDAVVANMGTAAETVWRNDGAGNFAAHPTTPDFGASDSHDLALGDLDGDGDLDAVVANAGDPAQAETVWRNDGAGNFTPHPTTPNFGGAVSTEVMLGDLDGDGDLDAVILNALSPSTVWLNDGAGNFTEHPTTDEFSSGGGSIAAAMADIDGDGDLDVVVAESSNAPETVWLNDGAGNFAPHPTAHTFGAGWSTNIVLGDLDGDGDADAIVSDSGLTNAPCSVYLNNGSGAFTLLSTFGNQITFGLALGDLDGDGDLDVIAANYQGQPERVFVNDGNGNMSAHPTVPMFGTGQSHDVALGDLDGDGDLDAVVANDFNGELETVWLNRAPAAVTVTQSGGTTTVSETGTSDTFTVVLANPPAANVMIDLSSLDTGEATVSPAQLTFTIANWATPQTVTVTGVDDAIDDASQNTTIALAMNTTDPLYTLVDPADVVATTTDDDPSATSTALNSSANPSLSGQLVTFTATVTSGVAGTITGTVTFFDGATPMGTHTLVSGSASLTTSSLNVGTHSITATYNGDTNYAASTSSALSQVVNASPFGAPPFFTAIALNTTQVALSWGAVSGATSYEVHRSTTVAGPYTLVATVTGTTTTNSGLAANTTYLYKVRANGSGGPSAFSPVDAATTVVFTDPALTSAVRIKAIHLTQLRTAVNAMRAAANLGAATFTDTPPVVIRRIHIIELRTALNEARAAIGLSASSYTDPTITAGVTKARKEHVSELRAGTQ